MRRVLAVLVALVTIALVTVAQVGLDTRPVDAQTPQSDPPTAHIDLGAAKRAAALSLGSPVDLDRVPLARQASCDTDWFSDPAFDIAALDIVTVTSVADCDGELRFDVDTRDRWPTSQLRSFWIDIDVDLDASTGCQGFDAGAVLVQDLSDGTFFTVMLGVPDCNADNWVPIGQVDAFRRDAAHLQLSFDGRIFGRGLMELPAAFAHRAYMETTGGSVDTAPDNPALRTVTVPRPPIGSVESVTTPRPEVVAVSGWAGDPNGTVVDMEVRLGDRTAVIAPVDLPRPDVAAAYPEVGGSTGFSFEFDAGTYGPTELCVVARKTFEGLAHTVELSCQMIDIPPVVPLGNLESVGTTGQAVVVQGWVGHPSGGAGAQVHVYLDGVFAGVATADIARPDVAATHPELGPNTGFSSSVAASPGNHEVCVFAINQDPSRPNPSLGCSGVEVPAVPPLGGVDSVTAENGVVTVTGWAGDPLDPSQDLVVNLTVDGEPVTSTVAGLARPDIAKLHPELDATTGFEQQLELGPGHHRVCALAVVARLNAHTNVGCGTGIVEATAFVGVRPVRLLDTRLSAPLTAGATLPVDPDGAAGVPPDAVVALSVTATGADGPGFLTVHRCDRTRPLAAALNFVPGRNASNLVLVEVSSTADVCVYANRGTHVVVDLVGWWPPGTEIEPVPTSRLLDTRDGTGTDSAGPVGAATVVVLDVTGVGGTPADGVSAVALNVAAAGAQGNGSVVVYPCDASGTPTAANLNFQPGATTANQVITSVSADGTVCLRTTAATHLVADLQAWWGTTTPYHPVVPARILDTREGTGTDAAAVVPAGTTLTVAVTGNGGVPAVDVGAVALNIAVVGAQGNGFLTVHSCDTATPAAASLTYAAGRTVATLVLTDLAANGTVCLYTHRTVHLVADVQGWWPST